MGGRHLYDRGCYRVEVARATCPRVLHWNWSGECLRAQPPGGSPLETVVLYAHTRAEGLGFRRVEVGEDQMDSCRTGSAAGSGAQGMSCRRRLSGATQSVHPVQCGRPSLCRASSGWCAVRTTCTSACTTTTRWTRSRLSRRTRTTSGERRGPWGRSQEVVPRWQRAA
jgi:hypothetical protein